MERQRRKETRERRWRRKRRIQQRIIKFFRLVIICLLIVTIGRMILEKRETSITSLPKETGSDTQQIQSATGESKQEELEKILNNTTDYPQNMREALQKNPELLDFVRAYPDAEHKVNGGITEEEKKQQFPIFLQWDSRWGYAPYGDDNIGLSGCAPTCLSMVIFSLTRDETATPDAIADFSTKGDYYSYGTGTKWTLLTDAAAEYGVTAKELSLDENVMKNRLDKGEMIICSMRAGDFTDGGHFIVIYGYDSKGFWVNDPNSRIRSLESWSYERLRGQIKNLWAYGLSV